MRIAKAAFGKLRGDFVAHLRTVADMEQEVDRYYYNNSQCWNLIRELIVKKDNPFVKHPAGYVIPCHRGTGPAISFKSVSLYARSWDDPQNPKEADVFMLDFTISYVLEEEKDYDYPNETEKRYSLNVPIELETDFTRSNFDVWTKQMKVKLKEESLEKARKTLAKLKAKYPELFRKKRSI